MYYYKQTFHVGIIIMINDDDDLIYIFIVTHKLERIYLLASKFFFG